MRRRVLVVVRVCVCGRQLRFDKGACGNMTHTNCSRISPLTPSPQPWLSSLPLEVAVDLVKSAFTSAGERDIYTVREVDAVTIPGAALRRAFSSMHFRSLCSQPAPHISKMTYPPPTHPDTITAAGRRCGDPHHDQGRRGDADPPPQARLIDILRLQFKNTKGAHAAGIVQCK